METSWYVVQDGKVINFIVADEDFIDAHMRPYGLLCIKLESLERPYPDIGWSYADGVFSSPDLIE